MSNVRRALLLCEEIGLWGTAHTDGTIILRLLPTGAAEERHTLTLDPDGPVPALNIPHFRAPFCVRGPSQPSFLRLHILSCPSSASLRECRACLDILCCC